MLLIVSTMRTCVHKKKAHQDRTLNSVKQTMPAIDSTIRRGYSEQRDTRTGQGEERLTSGCFRVVAALAQRGTLR